MIGEEAARTIAETVSKDKGKVQRSRTHAFMFQPLYFLFSEVPDTKM